MLFDIFDARARPGRSPRRGAPSARRARRRPRLALALALVALVAISTRESHADGLDEALCAEGTHDASPMAAQEEPGCPDGWACRPLSLTALQKLYDDNKERFGFGQRQLKIT